MSLAAGVVFLPAVEGACEARGDLGIQPVQRDHLLGDPAVMPLPSAAWKCSGFSIANECSSERARYGFLRSNAGCAVSAYTRSSEHGNHEPACTRNHLSTTRASPFHFS